MNQTNRTRNHRPEADDQQRIADHQRAGRAVGHQQHGQQQAESSVPQTKRAGIDHCRLLRICWKHEGDRQPHREQAGHFQAEIAGNAAHGSS